MLFLTAVHDKKQKHFSDVTKNSAIVEIGGHVEHRVSTLQSLFRDWSLDGVLILKYVQKK